MTRKNPIPNLNRKRELGRPDGVMWLSRPLWDRTRPKPPADRLVDLEVQARCRTWKRRHTSCREAFGRSIRTRLGRFSARPFIGLAVGLIVLMLHEVPDVETIGVVAEVRVSGAGGVSEQRVLAWLVTRPGSQLDSTVARADMGRILAGYREEGYWQVRVAYPRIHWAGAGHQVVFRVAEGQRTRIAGVELAGHAASRSESLEAVFNMRQGDPFWSAP